MRLFWRQLAAVGYEVRPGPGKLLRWGMADARLHDDLVLNLALGGVGRGGLAAQGGAAE